MEKPRRQVAVPKYSIFSTWHVGVECPKHEADHSLQRVPMVGMQTVLCLRLLHDSMTCCSYLTFNPSNPELNPICYLLALLAHHFLHVSRIMVKSLPLRLLLSYIYIYIYIYIYGAPILDVSRSHTTTQHSRMTPLDE